MDLDGIKIKTNVATLLRTGTVQGKALLSTLYPLYQYGNIVNADDKQTMITTMIISEQEYRTVSFCGNTKRMDKYLKTRKIY